MRARFAVCLCTGLAFVLNAFAYADVPAASTWRVSWLRVTLGEPMAAVSARLGDPLTDEDLGSGLRAARYMAGNPPVFLGVVHKSGNVVEISARAAPWAMSNSVTDPFGVALGMSEDAVVRLRGKPDATDNDAQVDRLLYGHNERWKYVIEHGKVAMILLAAPMDEIDRLAPSDMPVRHSGGSFSNAIVVKASNEENGVRFEYAYVALNACAAPQTPHTLNQALVQKGAHPFDVLTVVCGSITTPKTYYFDISSFFGK